MGKLSHKVVKWLDIELVAEGEKEPVSPKSHTSANQQTILLPPRGKIGGMAKGRKSNPIFIKRLHCKLFKKSLSF